MKKIYTLTIFLFLLVSISGCKPAETEVKPDYSTCKACGYTYNLMISTTMNSFGLMNLM